MVSYKLDCTIMDMNMNTIMNTNMNTNTTKLTIHTADDLQMVINVNDYPGTVFVSALEFKKMCGQPLIYKVAEDLDTFETILKVISGYIHLYEYKYDDIPLIASVQQYLPGYEPKEAEDESEDEYDYTDPYEIPKKRGPNYQEPKDSDEEDDYDPLEEYDQAFYSYYEGDC